MAKFRDFTVQGSAGAPDQNGASVGMLSVYDQETLAAVTIGPSDRLRISSAQLNTTEAAATLSAVGANAAGDAVTDKDATANTYTIDGDHGARYEGYTHVIAKGATAENGSHPITDVEVTGDPDPVTTVITVSTNLADATADGTLHGYNHASDTFLVADVANNAGYAAATFSPPFALRTGYAPFLFGVTQGMRIQIQGVLRAG